MSILVINDFIFQICYTRDLILISCNIMQRITRINEEINKSQSRFQNCNMRLLLCKDTSKHPILLVVYSL